MKAKNLLTTLLIVVSLQSIGQEYHKLINDSLYWDVAFKDPSYICNETVSKGHGDSFSREILSSMH